MNTLDTDAINLISKQVNEGRAEANKIDPDDMYVNFTPNGGIRIYRAETDKEKISKMRIPEYMKRKDKIGFIDKDHLIATLPPSSNLKNVIAKIRNRLK
jgi:predicted membrane GTPase involved in stress response